MNCTYKLKIRNQSSSRQETSIRRIRTDHLDAAKKLAKQPLADNKKILLNNQSSKPTKKATVIKSTMGKTNANYSRITTEHFDRPRYLQHHRTATATEKLSSSNQPKKPHTSSVVGASFKKKETKEPVYKVSAKQPSTTTGSSISNQIKGQARYEVEKKVGSGTFGTVHKARDRKSLEVVAIKKVFQDKNYKNRELDILKILSHPNVLSMKDSFFTYENDKEYLNVVMDYYEQNLYEAVKKYSKKSPMPRLKFKVYAYQLFRSLLYLKHIGIAHRDIKPQNVLVNEKNLKLVMCDFGSAKQLKPNEPNIAYICSRCYRAPELIFGNTQYTTQIDMWSTGCVLGEMILGTPMFQGESNIDQLVQIIKVVGCPSDQQILEMNPHYDINKFQLPKISGKSWPKIFPNGSFLGEEFFDLMKNVLCYSPSRRFTPFQALSHSFFDELRDQQVYRQLQEQVGVEGLFDFAQSGEASSGEAKKLIPGWY